MKKGLGSYVGAMTITFALIALFPSEISTWIGAIIFVFVGAIMPLGINLLLGGVAVSLFAFFSADVTLGMFMGLSYVLTGMIEGMVLRRQKGYATIVASGSIVRLLTMSFAYYYMSRVQNTTIRDLLLGGMPEAFEEYMKGAGYSPDPEVIKGSLEVMEMMLPSVFCIIAIIFAFSSFAGAMFVLKRRKVRFLWIRPFAEIKMDKIVTVFFLLLIILSLNMEGNLQVVLLNTVYVLCLVYAICGVAALVKLIKTKIKSGGIAALIIAVSGILTAGLIYPFSGIAASLVRKD